MFAIFQRDERGTAMTLGHMEERLVSAAIKVGKCMHIEHKEKFLQDLGVKKRMYHQNWCGT